MVFSLWIIFCLLPKHFPSPIFRTRSHLLLYSCISLFQTACVRLIPNFKQLKYLMFFKKGPVLFAQHAHTFSLPTCVSIQHSIPSSPTKMMFVHHYWSILAPALCITISPALIPPSCLHSSLPLSTLLTQDSSRVVIWEAKACLKLTCSLHINV